MFARREMRWACACVLSSLGPVAWGQINPPPGPIVETRPQIVSASGGLPIIIPAPGTYRLGSDVFAAGPTDGIHINAPDVTLDLDGHTLDGGGFAGNAIVMNAPGAVAIFNGIARFALFVFAFLDCRKLLVNFTAILKSFP